LLFFTILLVPIALAIWVSSSQAVRAISATFTLSWPIISQHVDDDYFLEARRNIQAHYRQFGVHLPIEDIVILGDDKDLQDQLTFLMRKACGQGNIFIWVPLKFNLPILGTRIVEWCWKTTSKQTER